MTVANMTIVREVAKNLNLEVDFVIFSMRDGDTPYLSDNEAEVFAITTWSLLNPAGYWSAVSRTKVVLDIGAGDSFADIYGLKRFLFLWLAKVIALVRGRMLLLSPQTIGPFTREPYKVLATSVLDRTYAVVVRDRQSLAALQELAPKARALLSVDVAFALPYIDRSAERGGPRLRVGVNVSGLLFHEAEVGTNRFGLSANYALVMRRFLAELTARPDVEVHLIVHVISKVVDPDDDGRPADRLHQEFPKTVRVPDFTGPCEAKSYISSLDFLVAARMHACIAAFSSGVPVVPIAYSRKFSGLFGLLDYSWVMPVQGFDDDQALAFLNDCFERRENLHTDTALGMAKVSDLLAVYRDELAKVMSASMSEAV
ncbi:polysaccharide pyruvyl transferase family protein [Phenylobacterium sp.]|uniref:polysaccharide pyruvyl transferase family protein n=1 Tax=Phenylobacterium sp. TaxID=1871053 RepID=UPI00374D4117